SEWLKELGIASAGEIYNAVDPDELLAASKRGERDFRARLGLEPNTPLIAFSGRLIPEKGVLQLADALKEIRGRAGNAALVMAGDGALRAELVARKQPGLFILGQLVYEDSLALISQADLFCLPTRSEGFSGAVLEAAALCTPIVTTPTGGSPELIPDDSYGLLIPDMSAESISEACIRALEDEGWRKEAAHRARQALVERFTWEKSCAALMNALLDLKHDTEEK
ncbi:MAG: glycosyltransferase family 4 protein, partial [Oscillospiraceae bacterium]|nr:glycosyltransferase family 4 protein [Oscillospiraceae bacterium]